MLAISFGERMLPDLERGLRRPNVALLAQLPLVVARDEVDVLGFRVLADRLDDGGEGLIEHFGAHAGPREASDRLGLVLLGVGVIPHGAPWLTLPGFRLSPVASGGARQTHASAFARESRVSTRFFGVDASDADPSASDEHVWPSHVRDRASDGRDEGSNGHDQSSDGHDRGSNGHDEASIGPDEAGIEPMKRTTSTMKRLTDASERPTRAFEPVMHS